jgi:hypothetical protein
MEILTHYQVAREKALEKYYTDPQHCKFCGQVISVPDHAKVTDIRRKTFCNQSCAASYNNNFKNGRKTGRHRQVPSNGFCERCGDEVNYQVRADRSGGFRKVRFCKECRVIVGHETQLQNKKEQGVLTWDLVSEMTKKELLDYYKGSPYWFKVKMTGHAQTIWRHTKRPNVCVVCGFEHINISHIKDVRDFDMETKIGAINSPDNLVGLCPNHHWLFDRGLLKLE